MIPWVLAALLAAPPPVKGRPDDFIGAIGRFTLSAEVRPARFRLDEPAVLVLRLTGAGDLSRARPPDVSGNKVFAARFDLVGPPTKKAAKDGVEFEYPIRARSTDVKAVPSLRLSTYDDAPPRPGYRLLRTAELPVEVLPAAPGDVVTPVPPADPRPVDVGRPPWTPLLVGAAVLVAVLLAAAASRRPQWRGSWRVTRAAGGVGRGEEGGARGEQSESTSSRPPAVPRSTRQRSQVAERPVPFVREDADRWLDRLGEALALPPGQWTSAEIVAAASRLPLEPAQVDALERNLAILDARRFGRLESVMVHEEELQAALDGISSKTKGGMPKL